MKRASAVVKRASAVAKREEDIDGLRKELQQAVQDAGELQELLQEADARHDADAVCLCISHPL